MGTLLIAAAKFQFNLSLVGVFFFSLKAPQVEMLSMEDQQIQPKLKIKRIVPKAE